MACSEIAKKQCGWWARGYNTDCAIFSSFSNHQLLLSKCNNHQEGGIEALTFWPDSEQICDHWLGVWLLRAACNLKWHLPEAPLEAQSLVGTLKPHMTSRGREQNREFARVRGVCQNNTKQRQLENKKKKVSCSLSIPMGFVVWLSASLALVLISSPKRCPWKVK